MPNVFTARELVVSNATLSATMLVKNLIDWFKANPSIEYATVIDAEGICGMVSRESVNARIASNKFGFAVLAEKPITKVMIEDPLIVEASLTANDLVRYLLQERADSPNFYQDIVVHENGNFLGLASVKRLIVKQMEQIMEQMRSMEKHQLVLAQKNRELFEATAHLSNDQDLFQDFFEKCSVPILVLNQAQQSVRANTRFYKLSGYTPEKLAQLSAAQLFEYKAFAHMLEAQQKIRGESTTHRATYTLSLLKEDGERQGVEVSINLDDRNGQVILSILRNLDRHEMAVAEAVQQKVSAQSNELARSVAENLIDKEYDLTAAMQKLDALISYADKIERKSQQAESPQLNDSISLAFQTLNGTLGQFSIVDLTQLLVQGRKTGQMVIAREDGTLASLFLDQGYIVHATWQHLRGLPALQKIMSLEHGSFVFHYEKTPSERTITGSDPMSILLEACAGSDEDDIVLPFPEYPNPSLNYEVAPNATA